MMIFFLKKINKTNKRTLLWHVKQEKYDKRTHIEHSSNLNFIFNSIVGAHRIMCTYLSMQ